MSKNKTIRNILESVARGGENRPPPCFLGHRNAENHHRDFGLVTQNPRAQGKLEKSPQGSPTRLKIGVADLVIRVTFEKRVNELRQAAKGTNQRGDINLSQPTLEELEKPCRSHQERAFSLIELLVVVAIISVLASLAVAGFRDMSTSRGVAQGASDVASLLELARTEAVNRRTFVWVLFKDSTNSGRLGLQMVMVASVDGSANAASTNLITMSRVINVNNCGLVPYSELSTGTKAMFVATTSPVSDLGTNGITFTNLPLARFTDKASVTFTPRGEALLLGEPSSLDGFDLTIGFGVVPTRGETKVLGAANDAGVVLDGGTGTARVLRF